MNRKEANQKLLEILKETLENNPDLRFIQALWALNLIDIHSMGNIAGDIVDRFYEESSTTLERITSAKE